MQLLKKETKQTPELLEKNYILFIKGFLYIASTHKLLMKNEETIDTIRLKLLLASSTLFKLLTKIKGKKTTLMLESLRKKGCPLYSLIGELFTQVHSVTAWEIFTSLLKELFKLKNILNQDFNLLNLQPFPLEKHEAISP